SECFVRLYSFFFNVAATPEIYTLSLHDALPISGEVGLVEVRRREMGGEQGEALREGLRFRRQLRRLPREPRQIELRVIEAGFARSEEHTSELQSRVDLVCRLLLEKKKNKI